MKRLLLMLALVTPALAAARQPDGVLGLILTPNNGAPALVLPGKTFEALLTERATLSLRGGGDYELAPVWTALPGGRFRAVCPVPESAPPGTYAIEARTSNQTDTTPRAVYVMASFPDTYAFAHTAGLDIGADATDENGVARNLIEAVNASTAAFLIVTGNLTANGTIEDFKQALAILDACEKPTFLCPGTHERGSVYETVFGPLPYAFWFGEDGYLVFDTKDFVPADDLDRQDADIELLRRALKPARWSIGLTHRYGPHVAMRAQITLLIDDPLDGLACGQRDDEAEEPGVPWGKTGVMVAPPAAKGGFRLVTMAPRGIRLVESQEVPTAVAQPSGPPEQER